MLAQLPNRNLPNRNFHWPRVVSCGCVFKRPYSPLELPDKWLNRSSQRRINPFQFPFRTCLRSLLPLLAAAPLAVPALHAQQKSAPANPAAAPHATPHVASVREADAACARCHQQIVKRYLATPMANASGNATDPGAVIPGGFTHQPSGITYKVFLTGAKPSLSAWLDYSRPASTAANAPAPLDGHQQLILYIGSDHRGRTFLYGIEDWWFEAPINYYRSTAGYDMAPNYLHVKQMPFNLPVDSACLHCHASSVQIQQQGTLNRYPVPSGYPPNSSLPFLQGGITCEACHGDATAHIASNGKAAVVNPSKLAPDRRDAICYRCHLEGETNVQNSARSPAEFKPGDRLEEFLTYFIRATPGGPTRAVSEVEALNLSRCKRVSGDRMTCTTCHDPHGDPAPADRVAFYRGRCLQCHTQEKFVSLSSPHAHHPEQHDCTVCHMPRLNAEDVAHEQTTEHRIPARPGEYSNQAIAQKDFLAFSGASPDPEKLIPVPGTTATPRDIAVATFNLIATGDLAAAQAALPLLESAYKQNPHDTQVLIDLAWLAQQRGDTRRATDLYSAALLEDPDNIAANTDFGVLLARAGNLQQAAQRWNVVFRRNPSISELGYDLGQIECALGNRVSAQNLLNRLLTFNPDDQRARSLLLDIASGRKPCRP
jgi:predicted CXXCH cytochrome family protein